MLGAPGRLRASPSLGNLQGLGEEGDWEDKRRSCVCSESGKGEVCEDKGWHPGGMELPAGLGLVGGRKALRGWGSCYLRG